MSGFDSDETLKEFICDIGDYVLATKYSDGDPRDHFIVGYVSGYYRGERYLVEDCNGVDQRFHRAERITEEEGHRLVEMMPLIGDVPGPSVWEHLYNMRKKQETRNKKRETRNIYANF